MDYVAITIPHDQQRYNTVGDWVFNKEHPMLHVNVSNMGSEDSEFLVAMHELIEAYLCRNVGITSEQVDQWDEDFERLGLENEPGEHPQCPYRIQHLIAESVERMLCDALNMKWKEHEENVARISNG